VDKGQTNWVLFEFVRASVANPTSVELRIVVDDRVGSPSWSETGRAWMRQELRSRERVKPQRKKVRRRRIRQGHTDRETKTGPEGDVGIS